jgi:hypothetical protein
VVWGVPFLGVYEEEDVLSLIETQPTLTTTVAGASRRRQVTCPTPNGMSCWTPSIHVHRRNSHTAPRYYPDFESLPPFFKRENIQVRSLGTVLVVERRVKG